MLKRKMSFYRSNPKEVFYKKVVIKNFAKITEKKTLCRRLNISLQPVTFSKTDSDTSVFLRILQNTKFSKIYQRIFRFIFMFPATGNIEIK